MFFSSFAQHHLIKIYLTHCQFHDRLNNFVGDYITRLYIYIYIYIYISIYIYMCVCVYVYQLELFQMLFFGIYSIIFF